MYRLPVLLRGAVIAAVVAVTSVAVACTGSAPAAPAGVEPPAPAASPASSTEPPPAATSTSSTVSSPPPSSEPVASTASIPDEDLPLIRFSTSDGGSVTLPVEVLPRNEFGIGLSGRHSLGERGMLFAFPQETETGFWMRNTHIGLDIAFVDASMRVIGIETMQAESEEIRRAPARYTAAVEAPAGWFARNRVEVGAAVTFEFDVEAVLAGDSPQ